ncbi:MAG TPA: hypothetical protein VIC32_08615 [Terriglobales bacterium]
MREVNQDRLAEREAVILQGVLDSYLAGGVPVGSRTLAEMRPDSPSSATIRHVLANLEQAGYLRQPHTSAGRIPTSKAICWWLERTAASGSGADKASLDDKAFRDGSFRLERALLEASDEATLWRLASEFLSDTARQVGVITVKPWHDTGLKQLRFFRLTDHRVLAILVATDGQVRERINRLPDAYSQAELDAAARYFNLNFAGSTLSAIRRELRHRLEEERAAYDELLKRVVVLSHSGVLEMEDSGAVYLEGAQHLAGLLDGDKLGELLAQLNQKERWLRLLAASEESSPARDTVELGHGAVRVQVGLDQMPECSLISSRYKYGSYAGAIGILGSTRMEYQRALAAVTVVGELFHRILGESSL